MKSSAFILYKIFNYLFWVSAFSFAVSYLIEMKMPGLIAGYVNPNWILGAALVSVIFSALLENKVAAPK